MYKKIAKIFLTGLTVLFSAGVAHADFNSQIVVDAGPSLYVSPGQTVVLQGSGYDANGNSVNYWWSCDGGQVSSYNAQQPTYTPPLTYGAASYVCTLRVTNNGGLSNIDSTTVYVNWNNSNNNNFVQTNSAVDVNNNQATLRGRINSANYNNTTNVFFQWGPTINYGSQTPSQNISGNGEFSQIISGLSYDTTYHFRAVAQGSFGTIYGQDVIFNTNSYNYYYFQNQSGGYANTVFSITKRVINLTTGNLQWSSSVNAKPNDVLSFSITINPSNQNMHNVQVRDILPANLIYLDRLTVNAGQNFSGNIFSGITLGTIYANQPVIIAYQAQVGSVPYGTTTITNSAIATSNQGSTQSSSASVVVNNSYVAGATSISTGVTNNPITDSFLIPVALIILMSYLYFSGKIYVFADWLGTKL